MRRSRADVVKDILAEALQQTTKTQLVYLANLNYTRGMRYFYQLRDKGLITFVLNSDKQIVIKTTKRGEDFLQLLRRVEEIFPV